MRRFWVIAGPVLFAASAHAHGIGDAIAGGTPLIDIRLRYDTVDQPSKPKDAQATTVRARLGYRTGVYDGFSGLVEFDVVQHLGGRTFNDSINGLTQYPTIADPDLVALNRLQLNYETRAFASADMAPDLTFIAGRQEILSSDQRYIGNSAWRQHAQTYDALTLADTSIPGVTLTYSYIAQVNRPPGPRSPVGHFDSDSHLFDAVYTGAPHLKLQGFLYLLDFRQAPTLSSATLGARADLSLDLGAGWAANIMATIARQRDYGRNPLSIDLGNYRAEGGLNYRGLSGLVGYEVLEGNGTIGFETPLGLGHLFQGWAETFTTKPPEGVTDAYVKASYAFTGVPFIARLVPGITYHDFSAEHVSADYGREWDAILEAQVDKRLTLDVSYADYHGAGPFPDKREFWTYATYHY
jgi:hypothetical protein